MFQAIDNLIARVQMPYQGTAAELRFAPSKMFLHSFSVKEFVTIQCHLDFKTLGGRVSSSDITALRNSAVRIARALALTSYILIKLLSDPSSPHQGKRIELDGVQLVTGTNFTTINWTNVVLDNAYLPGIPAYFSCRSCSFRFAALQDLNFSNGYDLTNSDMTGAHLK